MKQQRSSGGEKFVRGLLVLPELRRPSRHDTPKITNPVSQRTFPSIASLPRALLSILKRPWVAGFENCALVLGCW
jgi:hypothetical protein